MTPFTFIRLPKSNADAFPGHGNASGATAGCKLDLTFDLLGGEIIHNQLHLGDEQDNTIGIANFRVIEGLGAYWLSRRPLTANAVSEDRVPLEKLLKNHRGDVLDIQIKLTVEGHPMRLVAIRASKREAKGRAVPAKTLTRDGWHLRVTKIPQDLQSPAELAVIHSQH